MKKTMALLLAITLTLLCAVSLAEVPLTRYTGKCGFTMDYPEEWMDVYAYGLNTTFVAKDENTVLNLTVLAQENISADPVGELAGRMRDFGLSGGREDVSVLKTNSGTDVFTCAIPGDDSITDEYILIEDGRQFYLSAYMHDAEQYRDLTRAMVLSFAADPDGDFSGYEEALLEEDLEPDYASVMLDLYAPVLTQWGTAAWEKREPSALAEEGISPLLALMDYRADEIHIDFIDPEGNGNAAMILYTTPADGSAGADLLAVYTREEDGTIRPAAVSSEHDLFSLYGNAETGYYLREDAANGAAESTTVFRDADGKTVLAVTRGVNDQGETVWTRSGEQPGEETPVTEEEAAELLAAYRPWDEEGAWIFLSDYMRVDLGLLTDEGE